MILPKVSYTLARDSRRRSDQDTERHEGHYVSLTHKSLTLGNDKIKIEKGETIQIEHSYKVRQIGTHLR